MALKTWDMSMNLLVNSSSHSGLTFPLEWVLGSMWKWEIAKLKTLFYLKRQLKIEIDCCDV